MSPSLSNVRNLKVNARWAGKPCAKCSIALGLGESASICEVCGSPHHQECWVANNGCAGDSDCSNAPPPVEAPSQPSEPTPGFVECPNCGNRERSSMRYCTACRTVFDPADVQRAPGALASLVCGSIALLAGGWIFVYFAVKQGGKALALIESDPTYTGAKMARAGRIMAWVAIPFWILIFLVGESVK